VFTGDASVKWTIDNAPVKIKKVCRSSEITEAKILQMQALLRSPGTRLFQYNYGVGPE